MKKSWFITSLFLLFYLSIFSQKINRLNNNKQRTGKWVMYYDSTQKIKSFEGRFRNGAPVGKAVYYNSEGGTDRKDIHRFGKIKTIFYNTDGSKSMEGRSRIENLPDKVHYYFYGRWKYYDEKGRLVKYGYYKKGKLVKSRYLNGETTNDSLISYLVQMEKDFNLRNRSVLDSIVRDYHNVASRERFQRKLFRTDTITFSRLEAYLRIYGYPTKKEVGEAVEIPFYILSNAPVAIKLKYLPLLKEAADRGDLEWRTLAFFIDKIKIAEGKEQIYGTQYYFNTKREMVYYPVEDPQNLQTRRSKVGLE